MKKSTFVTYLIALAVTISFVAVGCTYIFSKDNSQSIVVPSAVDYVKYAKVTGYDVKEVKFTDNVYSVKVIDGSTIPPVVIKKVTLDESRTISMRVINQSVVLYDAAGNEIISSEIPLIAAK